MKRNLLISGLALACIAAVALWTSGRIPPGGRTGAGAASPARPAGIFTPATSPWTRELPARPDAESLAALRSRFLALPPEEAVAEIGRFLATGEDRPTGIDFEIGGDGALTGWPTLRVFLLDLLQGIDGPAAARIGREILASPTTADEWALALRNVAKAEDSVESRDYLRQKTGELIAHSAWQEKPSVGYLNAFDVLVHTGATGSTPLLSGLIQRKDRRDLAHASFLTLDRLTQRAPVDMLARLKSDTALQASRPEMVAQQFARADLRIEPQRELVKGWLLDPARTSLELRTFAETYPNNNQMVSNNLLTSGAQLSGADLAKHDREVLELMRGWQTDPAFQSISPHLATIADRLSEFVQESSSAANPPSK